MISILMEDRVTKTTGQQRRQCGDLSRLLLPNLFTCLTEYIKPEETPRSNKNGGAHGKATVESKDFSSTLMPGHSYARSSYIERAEVGSRTNCPLARTSKQTFS